MSTGPSGAPRDGLISDKTEMRRRMAERRAALHAADPMAPLVLAARLPRPGPVGIAAAYWPMRSEIDPRPLMGRLARAGWRLGLPVTPARSVAAPLVFRAWRPGDGLADHAFGMQEPHPHAEIVRPDLVLVPLLAFDGRGHRLGYGAGHYDRTLAALRATGAVRAIGLAFEGQRVEAVPVGPHDQPLDAILTERAFREFANTPQ